MSPRFLGGVIVLSIAEQYLASSGQVNRRNAEETEDTEVLEI